DFAYFQQRIPGLYFLLGIKPADTPKEKAAPNHSPRFFVDEQALPVGVKALTQLTLDYLNGE
ncbi:MAG: amidohydrolase, partial [Burkholderiales bacterium]